MTEKIGLIKNPLTIIAIFAGIAEVSGTVVLPFVDTKNQELFIWFLISFPTALVALFFITLNFNNKVLYAPSDYKDESNYLSINRYNILTQKNVEVEIPKENLEVERFDDFNNRLKYLSIQIERIESSLSEKEETKAEAGASEEYVETIGFTYSVTRFENANEFVSEMDKANIEIEIYDQPDKPNEVEKDLSKYRAIWLGPHIPAKVAIYVIKRAKQFYPHLRYIGMVDYSDIYI